MSLERIDNNDRYSPSNCTWSDVESQARNKRLYRTSTTGVSGVNFRKDNGKYRVLISINGKQKTIGHFDNLEEAIAARMEAEAEYWGRNKPEKP